MKTTSNYYSHSRPEIAFFVPKTIKTVLDIGCGEGDFLRYVKDKTNAETWGVEAIESVAKEVKNHIDKTLVGKVEDIINLLPDAYFDCITFNDVLEHLLEPTEVLKLIKPKLTENGIVIASIPNIREYYHLYELLFKKDWKYKDEGILDSTHIRFFTKISMARLFNDAGFKLISQAGINKTKSWKFKIINMLTFGYFSDSAYFQFVCIATRR